MSREHKEKTVCYYGLDDAWEGAASEAHRRSISWIRQ